MTYTLFLFETYQLIQGAKLQMIRIYAGMSATKWILGNQENLSASKNYSKGRICNAKNVDAGQIWDIAACISLQAVEDVYFNVSRHIVAGHLRELGLVVHCPAMIPFIINKNIADRLAFVSEHVCWSDVKMGIGVFSEMKANSF